jgi:hypothetical protein
VTIDRVVQEPGDALSMNSSCVNLGERVPLEAAHKQHTTSPISTNHSDLPRGADPVGEVPGVGNSTLKVQNVVEDSLANCETHGQDGCNESHNQAGKSDSKYVS